MPLATQETAARARRILVDGVSGSGKSTAARRIAARRGLVFADRDELLWLPGWVPVDEGTQCDAVSRLVAGEAWVFDGTHGPWRQLVLDRVDLLVGLDYPRWLSFLRLLRRTVLRAVRRTPICHGNVESWRRAFAGRDSILLWHVTSFAGKRAGIRRLAAAESGPPVLVFRRPRDLDAWIDSLPPTHESVAP